MLLTNIDITMYVMIIVIFQVTHFSYFVYSKETCEFEGNKTENKQLIEKNIVSLSPMGIQHCSKQCSTTSGCLSFNFHREHLTCELNFASTNTEVLVTNDQYDYYEINDQETADIEGCSNMNCSLRSRCIDIKDYGPYCTTFECSEPLPINNAILHPGTNLVGSTREYTCSNFPSCSKSVTCQYNGSWTPISLRCEIEFYCDVDWSLIANSCYKIHYDLATWPFAQSICNSKGGYLVRIETSAENEFLKLMVNPTAIASYYVGATEEDGTDIWKYGLLGSNIVFADWYPGEPNDGINAQRCAAAHRSLNFKWDDGHCSLNINYICEKSENVRLRYGC